MKLVLPIVAALAATLSHAQTLPGSNMPAVNLDTDSMTTSGISSGGFMAVQMQVSFSSLFHTGVGVLAGGPYWCAMDSVGLAVSSCMSVGSTVSCTVVDANGNCTALGTAQIDISVLETITTWTSYWGFADPTDNLRNSRVWVLSAQQDSVVATEVVKKLQEFYTLFNDDPSDNIKGVYNQSGEHSQLTLDYGNDCTTLAEPYLNKCGYDAAGNLLQHIFKNTLVTPPGTAYNGSVYSFNQAIFFDGEVWASTFGMSKEGYIYIPKTCAAGAKCKLHVAFHGCEMTPDDIGTQYVEHGGYNSWADLNNMVVLYPQAKTNALNPKGCWDWWSYSGIAYASKIGTQTLTVKRMIDSLTGAPRTANGTLCEAHQEAHMHAVLEKVASLPTKGIPAVRSAGVFEDDALNAALGNPVQENKGICWPSEGFQMFARAAAAGNIPPLSMQNLRGQ